MSTTSPSRTFSFYEIQPNGKIVFFVDASLLKSFSSCERYFYLHHIKNYRPKGIASGIKPFPMAIGCWWSDVMEMFYNALRAKQEVTSDSILTFATEAWARNQLDLCALHEPDKFESFGDIAGAVLMLQDYYYSQYLIDKNNWQVVSVEEGFGLNKEVLLGESSRVVVYWIGKPDLVVVENGRLTPVDHKTVSRIDGSTTNRYKPSTQMPGYVYSCEVIAKSLGYDVRVDRCVVNICSRSRPTEKPRGGGAKRPRFIRAYPNFNREEIEEWRKQVIFKCERIAHCLKTGEWAWSETSCDNFYMRPCDYKKLDSTTPSARDVILQADFVTAQPWVPYQLSKLKGDDE
jgi:PD-(D/E)XK nuclease superfamily